MLQVQSVSKKHGGKFIENSGKSDVHTHAHQNAKMWEMAGRSMSKRALRPWKWNMALTSMSTWAIRRGNGGKVNVQVNIETMKIDYGGKFNVYLSIKKSHLAGRVRKWLTCVAWRYLCLRGFAHLEKAMGLNLTATARDIRIRFRILSLIYHPDRYSPATLDISPLEAQAHFQLINNAHAYLRTCNL